MLNEIEQKQLATKIAKVASKIVPELVKLTKGTEFSLTLLDDGEGFGMIINVSNVPQMVSIILPELLKKEDDVEVVELNDGEDMETIEEGAIRNALEKSKWDKREAAALLGISERTLHRKIKEYGMKK